MLQQVVPQATRLGFLQLREAREKWRLPKEQSNWMGVTWVGPALNHPIDEAEYRRVFAGLIQDRAEGILVTDEDVHVDAPSLPRLGRTKRGAEQRGRLAAQLPVYRQLTLVN
jgi:hypothetical protein